jgi:arylsulfatase A-like enzyme
MTAPPGRKADFTLNEDLADHAIDWIKAEKSLAPDKPFFVYYAPGGTHAPLQAPAAWIDKFKGQFDMGWDRYREIVFERQKKLGVIPPDARLTPRPKEIPAWDSLTADQQKVAARPDGSVCRISWRRPITRSDASSKLFATRGNSTTR